MSLYCVKIKYSLDAISGMMSDGIDRALSYERIN